MAYLNNISKNVDTVTMNNCQSETHLDIVIYGSGAAVLAERNNLDLYTTDRSHYHLEMEQFAADQVELRLVSNIILGRVLTPDGDVPQIARLRIRRQRTGVAQFKRNWARFVRACVVDNTVTPDEQDVIRFFVNSKQARVDLAILSNHAEPHYDTSDPADVVTVLYDLASLAPRYIARMLVSMAHEMQVGKPWTLE